MEEGDFEDMEVPDEEVIAQNISAFKAAVEENENDYDSHIGLIKALEEAAELMELREAREHAARLFPLTPEMWLKWAKDERSLVTSEDGKPNEEEKERIQSIFERGTEDYVSVDLWSEYLQWAIGSGMTSKEVRELFEKALMMTGLHADKGIVVWEVYQVWEKLLMSQGLGSDVEKQQQRDRVCKLYKRMFSVPLLGLKDSFEEYVDFMTQNDLEVPEDVQRSFSNSMVKVEELTEFEKAIENARNDEQKILAYLKYVEFEKKGKDPGRIQSIFERFVAAFPLRVKGWVEYLGWLDNDLKIMDVAFPVYKRAIRNCPSGTDIWIRYMWALERAGKDDELDEAFLEFLLLKCKIFQKATSCGYTKAPDGVQLFLNYNYALRRRADKIATEPRSEHHYADVVKAFETGADSLKAYIGDKWWDPQGTYRRRWAHFLAAKCNNPEGSRAIWRDLMASFGSQAHFWLENISEERAFATDEYRIERCRKLFVQGVNSVTDDPEIMCEMMIQFEREEGTMETLDMANRRVESRMILVKKRREDEAEKGAHEKKGGGWSKGKQRGGKGGFGQKWPQKSWRSHKWNPEAAAAEPEPAPAAAPSNKGARKRRGDSDMVIVRGEPETPPKDTPPVQKDNEGFAMPALPGPSSKKMKISPKKEEAVGESPVKVEPKEKPGAEGHVQPTSSSSTSEEKQKDPVPVKAEPMEAEETEKKPSTDEIDTSKYDRTIFVSNLVPSVTEERLKGLFAPIGAVESVRIVKKKGQGGKFNCFGFLEFVSAQTVPLALRMDRTPIENRPMYVKVCEDRSKTQATAGIGYKTELEKTKLFLRQLPKNITQTELLEILEPHAKVKDVRIPTFPNGQGKGIAYVEFNDEEGAQKALVNTDGMLIKGQKISVAISNPPPKRGPGEGPSQGGRRMGAAAAGAKAAQGRRPQMFAPRVFSAGKPKAEAKPAAAGSTSKGAEAEMDANGSEVPSVKGSSDAAKKSNAEFRALFFKKD